MTGRPVRRGVPVAAPDALAFLAESAGVSAVMSAVTVLQLFDLGAPAEEAGRVHPELTAALAPLLVDLAVPSGVEPTVSEQKWQDHPGSASCFLSGPDGFGMGVWICLGEPLAAQVVMLADQVQEWAVEALWHLGRSAAWPACPYHPERHPLAVREVGGRALWLCPLLEREVSAVGALAGARVRPRQVRQARRRA